MHFVTGGAYNGKAKWVRRYYGLDDTSIQWISAYQDEPLPLHFHENTVVLQGIEAWIERDVSEHDADAAAIRLKWREIIGQWKMWEAATEHRRCILIGADITKGIVPIEVNHRIWRDAVGWVFQDIVAASSRVDVIWYGVSQQLK
jgi:adenosylcobinamide kinase / adenosylcobinamide-phosphate guanylyltransferase